MTQTAQKTPARASIVTGLLTMALATTAAWATGADTGEFAPEPASATYWLRNREGWFWYRDPPAAERRGPPARNPSRELAQFEAMQKRLEDLKRIAIVNPTDTNLMAYMRFQRWVMDKSEHFATRWQRLVWTVPDLDYGLSGRPTNALAINVFDEAQRDHQTAIIRKLAATHGLVFLFRSDCPHCHRFAPILKRFAEEFEFTVLAISLDGGAIAEYPNARPDTGIAARLNATAVPALYLTVPATGAIIPVGFGVMSLSDLIERIAALAPNNATDATQAQRNPP